MPTRGRSRSSFRRARTKTVWSQNRFTHQLGIGGVESITDISHPAIGANNEPTGAILRMLGTWNVSPVVGGSLEDYEFAVGVSVVTIDALSAGATPDPLTDVTQDWYFWDSWLGKLNAVGTSTYTKSFDIRSSRRLREGFRLVWVTENPAIEIAGLLSMSLRTLWKMP